MDLRLSPEQEQLVEAFASLFAKESSAEHVRAAEPLGFDRSLWDHLVEQGIVAMSVGEEVGGWGASLLDLVLVAEQAGRYVAPAPIIDAQVAARLLTRLDGDAAAAALAATLSGEQIITLAVRPAVGERAELVPAAAVADQAVIRSGDRLLLVPLVGRATGVENLASMPLADVTIDGDAVELASGAGALEAFDCALDDWLALTSAALVGIGAKALELGVDYVKERKAWGVPIGSFQGISHRLADSKAAVDGAQLLAYEAAWAVDEDADRFRELAAMSFGFAYETARDATYRSLHFHGGYGFMMEYDVQLYYRRARGWAGVFGEPSAAYRRVADARYGKVG